MPDAQAAEAGWAVQAAVLPPLEPAQVQFQGPEPVTADAAPAEQRFPDGAEARDPPVNAVLHAPLTAEGDRAAEQRGEFAPAFKPTHVQLHGPEPATGTGDGVPAEHRPAAGATVSGWPFEGPHDPASGVGGAAALHEAVSPPLEPAQVQVHGPVPLSVEAVPAEQRLAVGAVVSVLPLAEPHTPSVVAVVLMKLAFPSLYTFPLGVSVT